MGWLARFFRIRIFRAHIRNGRGVSDYEDVIDEAMEHVWQDL